MEGVSRGPYGGAVGWFSGSGDAQLAIAIRTLLRSEGRLFAHAGAGIVAASDPVLGAERKCKRESPRVGAGGERREQVAGRSMEHAD